MAENVLKAVLGVVVALSGAGAAPLPTLPAPTVQRSGALTVTLGFEANVSGQRVRGVATLSDADRSRAARSLYRLQLTEGKGGAVLQGRSGELKFSLEPGGKAKTLSLKTKLAPPGTGQCVVLNVRLFNPALERLFPLEPVIHCR